MSQTQIKQKQLELITSSNINDAIANSAIPATKLATTATAKAIATKIQTEVANAQIGGSMIFKGGWSTATINSTVKAC